LRRRHVSASMSSSGFPAFCDVFFEDDILFALVDVFFRISAISCPLRLAALVRRSPPRNEVRGRLSRRFAGEEICAPSLSSPMRSMEGGGPPKAVEGAACLRGEEDSV